jgi:predicted site-specific integrase-resolvase
VDQNVSEVESTVDPSAAMRLMSRAIRGVIEKFAPTLSELDDDVLRDLAHIVTAFSLDLRGEQENRRD